MVPVEDEQEEMQGKGRKPVEGERKEAGDQLARAGDEAAKAAEKAKTEAARAVLELTEQARVERKRNREKQRRSDVTKGLEALMEQIFIIDPKLRLDAEDRAANSSGGRMPISDSSLLSRVELVNIAVGTMKRLHQENEERKSIITGLLANGVAPPASVLPSLRELQAREEIQQRLNLEALLGNSSGASGIQQSFHEGLASSQTTSIGSLVAPRRGAASLVCPTASNLSLGVERSPSAAASLLRGLTNQDLSVRNGLEEMTGNHALYQLLLNRRIQDEESAALAVAGIPPIGQGLLSGAGYLNGRDPGASFHPRSQRLVGGSIREAAMRGQTIAEAAAARSAFANGEEPDAKRFKGGRLA